MNKEIVTAKNLDRLENALRDDEYQEVDITVLFLVMFKRIPKYKRRVNNVSVKFYKHLEKNGELIHSIRYDGDQLQGEYGRYIFYYKESLVEFFKSNQDNEWGDVNFASDDSNFGDEIFQNRVVEKDTDDLAYFGIVLQKTGGGLQIKRFPLKMPDLSIPLHYGKGFVRKNKAITDSISKNNHGLYLFHGSPGTGKTTYIKYLAHLLGDKSKPEVDIFRNMVLENGERPIKKEKEKLFVYLPTQLMNNVTDPSFASLLLDQNNDIVLILEDAEEYIKSREETMNHSAVATLLNLTDGIMGSILNVSIIVTFNIDTDKIDIALRRKGRLFAEHKFENLSIEDSQKLFNNLKIKHKVEKPMSLAEIYNFELENFAEKDKENKIMGFGK